MPRKSLRQAINDTCKQCIYDKSAAGTWLQQVTECTAEETCPLWKVRPTTNILKIGVVTNVYVKQTDNL